MSSERKMPTQLSLGQDLPTKSEAASKTDLERKTARLKAMLSRPDGVSIEEISEAFGWQPHSSRAALSGLRKQGHTIERDKVGSVTVYRMVGE